MTTDRNLSRRTFVSGSAAAAAAAAVAVKSVGAEDHSGHGSPSFVPARQGTQPVDAWVLVPIVFNLQG